MSQRNGYNCGLFLLYQAEQFLHDRDALLHQLCTPGQLQPAFDADQMRASIRDLIFNRKSLQDQAAPTTPTEDGNDAEVIEVSNTADMPICSATPETSMLAQAASPHGQTGCHSIRAVVSPDSAPTVVDGALQGQTSLRDGEAL